MVSEPPKTDQSSRTEKNSSLFFKNKFFFVKKLNFSAKATICSAKATFFLEKATFWCLFGQNSIYSAIARTKSRQLVHSSYTARSARHLDYSLKHFVEHLGCSSSLFGYFILPIKISSATWSFCSVALFSNLILPIKSSSATKSHRSNTFLGSFPRQDHSADRFNFDLFGR